MWKIGAEELTSRLFVGTARYPSPAIMVQAIAEAAADVVTVSLRRQDPRAAGGHSFWEAVRGTGCRVLPNTAGCHGVDEAVTTAQMARELFETHWIKLEVIGDDQTLQPDPMALVTAAEQLVKDGFEVFPYCTEDLVICRRLLDVGCRVLMPWGSPIGSGRGLNNPYGLKTLRQRLPDTPLIIDAGLGAPSHAAAAMELGYDAVLLNTAVATAIDPVKMAGAFRDGVRAGRGAFEAGLMPMRDLAAASTPVAGRPFWHANKAGSDVTPIGSRGGSS